VVGYCRRVNSASIRLALSYDDVLLSPRRSGIGSRSDVDVSTRLTRRLRLAIPVVSANMDTVTEAEMAIAMARAGGIGIVHRFLTVERQVAEVARVKRAEALVIADPHTIGPDATLAEAREAMERLGTTSLVVIDPGERLVGILTRRDVMLQTDPLIAVRELMTPRERMVTGAPDTTSDQAARLLRDARVEKLPLVGAGDRLVGLITLRDLLQRAERPDATKDERGRLAVGAAIGVRGDYVERARALQEAGADVVVLDIAHGHADHSLAAVSTVREALGDRTDIIAGNVATAEGARDLAQAGADGVKVGVGPGSVCTTRVVAGVGVPQLTAVMECAEACAPHGVPVIADGGIRVGGDVAKAIAAGAETVMVGNLLAGTPESPGVAVSRNGARVKVFRGMASNAAATARRAAEGEDDTEFNPVVAEGVEAVVPLRDAVAVILHGLVGGLRSGMSYSDARTITEFHRNAHFVRITPGGLRESYPHDVSY
jgi:IMP dehydrogenase